MTDVPLAEDLDPVWRALSDPTRRRLLDLLRSAARTTGELSAAVPEMTRFAVMKHLRVLEQVGLIRVEPRGRERWNHLNVVPLQQISERWLRPYEAVWASRLLRLRTAIETEEEPDVDAHVLVVDQEITIAAPRERVFAALTDGIGEWWGPPYVVSEDRVGLALELRAGGLLWEDWGDGQGVAWASLVGFRRNERLDFSGTFRMPGALGGTASFELAEEPSGTRVRLHQEAVGAMPEDVGARWTAGWEDLLGRLAAAAEAPTS